MLYEVITQGHQMPAIVADDALRLPRRSRRIENVQRVGGCDRYASRRRRRSDPIGPVELGAGAERCPGRLALQNDAMLRRMRSYNFV